jgi:sugar O-acyltransferase (sialic acid O-acetyltransferase NeuD family)
VSRIIVIGGSDQGRQVIDALTARGDDTIVGILDRAIPRGTAIDGVPVIGTDDELQASALQANADGYVVAIGDNFARGAILERERAACPHLAAVTVTHPAAVVARDAVIGAGSILLAGAVVSNGCTVGRGVLLGTNSSIDHDCTVDDHASLGPGVATGGTVHIGHASAIGVGASVVHGISIGDHTVIGAGAVVAADIPECVIAYGVPAKVATARRPGDPYL